MSQTTRRYRGCIHHSGSFFLLVAGLALCSLLLTPTAYAVDLDWDQHHLYEDANTNRIELIDAVVDTNDVLHIIYRTGGPEYDIIYLRPDETNFVPELVYNGELIGGWYGEPLTPAMVIQDNGQPLIVFGLREATSSRYSRMMLAERNSNGNWYDTTLETWTAHNSAVYSWDVTLGASGAVHVAYGTYYGLTYKRRDPRGSWHTEVLRTGATSSGGTGIAVDTLGNPHVVQAINDNTYGVLYCDWTGSAWNCVTSGAKYASGISVAADPVQPVVHAFYGDNISVGNLRHAVFSGSSWVDIETPIGGSVSATDVIVRPDRSLRVAIGRLVTLGYLTKEYPAGSYQYQALPMASGHPIALGLTTTDEPRIITPLGNGLSTGTHVLLNEYTVPKPAFTATPTWGAAPLTVQFANTSKGTIRGQRWNFGDGGGSTETNPEHIYSQSGDYTVSLTVSNTTESVVHTEPDLISIQKWFIETLDDPPVLAGARPTHSFGMLPGEKPCFAAFNQTDTNLTFVSTDGTNWNTDTVDATAYSGYGGISLAVDGSDNPCVAYRVGALTAALRYACHDGASWQVSTIDSGQDTGNGCALALDSSDTPHVVYPARFEIRYAVKSGATWVPETVAAVSNLYPLPSIALDGFGEPRVCYYDLGDQSLGSLVYAERNGASWQVETVTGGVSGVSAPGYGASLAIDSLGHPCISYVVAYTTPQHYELVYSRNEGTGWVSQTIADLGYNYMDPLHTSLQLTITDRARIAFYDHTLGTLCYAEETSEGWDIETVDGQTSTVGWNPALLLDPNGSPRIGYFDRSNSRLKWAKTDQPPELTAAFSVDKPNGTAPWTVNFTDESSGAVLTWSWDFGDGATSTAQQPSHAYTSNGNYTVSLTVTDSISSNTHTKTDAIQLAPLTAEFSADPLGGPAPLEVQFTSLATGNAKYHYWTFGDGTTSTEVNPLHTYTFTGDLSVFLRVGDGSTQDELWKHDYIHVGDIGAEFTSDLQTGYEPLTVTFTNLSFGTITNYTWRFGDGALSHEMHPTHTYASNGVYEVSLAVKGPEGEVTEIKTDYMTVLAGLKADFTASPRAGAGPLAVTFTNQSQGAISSYSWEFGDGGVASIENPVHSYQSNGLFTVALTISNADDTNALTRTNYISVSDFTVEETSPQDGAWAVMSETNLTVKFSVSVSNVSVQTFQVSIENDGTYLLGTVNELDGQTYEFVPDEPLPRGKTIVAMIQGGADGVRSALNATPLSQDHTWRFQTYPEVTIKAIQVCEADEAFLLAGKATMLRAFMSPLNTNEAETVVMASLHIDGTQVIAPAAYTVKRSYNVYEQKQGKNSINLFIPTSGTPLDIAGDHTLTLTLMPQDPEAAANAGGDAEHDHFVILNAATKPYRVEFVACNEGAWDKPMTPAQLKDYYRTAIAHSDFMKAAFPVTETTYRPIIESTEVKVNSWSPLVNYVDMFKWKYYMIHLDRRAKANPNIDRVVGIVPYHELGIETSGMALGNDVAGVLIDSDADTYMTASHEIMHSYGHYIDPHEEYQDNGPFGRFADPGWWVAKRQDGCIINYNPDTTTPEDFLDKTYRENGLRVRPAHYFSFMGETTPVAWWMRRADYHTLYYKLVEPPSAASSLKRSATPQADPAEDMTLALVSGQVWSNGAVTINPLIFSPGLSDETPEDYTSFYTASFWAGPSLKRTFYFPTYTFAGVPEITAAFSFIASVPASTDRVVIQANGPDPLADISASTYAPITQILSPNGGETLSGTTTITWDSMDFDVDDMTHTLYYSPDGGANWSLLDLDLTNLASFVWDTGGYPGSTNGFIKILTCDGFHTTEDISDAPFTILPSPPVLFIVQPETDILVCEDGLSLRALVHDSGGDSPADVTVRWISDQEGILGSGLALDVTQLAYGTHTISCEGINSGGFTGVSEAVSIDVRPLITDFTSGSNGSRLSWFARDGQPYSVLGSDSLPLSDWRTISNLTDIAGTPTSATIVGGGAETTVIITHITPKTFYYIRADTSP